jgi:DNA-binding NarL/FixJ family response regulator
MRAIATKWTIFAASDGVAGLEFARRYVEQLALVLLDMDLPGIGGYNTCLLLRAVSPTLHILPITVDATPIPLLAELGCLPPLVKPLGRGALRAAFHAARSAPRPDIRPGPAVLALAQRHAAAREHAARQSRVDQRIVLFAACPITRLGLAQYLTAATTAFVEEAPSIESLEQLLRDGNISAIVADARDHAIVCAISSEHAVPILLVAATPLEGLIAAAHACVTGVALTSDDPTTTLAAALTAVTTGQQYRSPELDAPFAALGLTPCEQTHLALEAQHFSAKAIAERLGVEVKTVSQYRQRLRNKLGLTQADELSQWARTQLQTRTRTVGE